MIVKSSQFDLGHPRALTLIELLAVIVIASMVAGVATIGLAATSDTARLRAAAAHWRDLDARARVFSRSLGPVEMAVDEDGREVQLYLVRSGELLSAMSLPEPMQGRIRAPGDPRSILFDSHGRTIDYQVDLRADDRVVTWHVCGLTGLTREAQP